MYVERLTIWQNPSPEVWLLAAIRLRAIRVCGRKELELCLRGASFFSLGGP
jgi:hypothetical protein